MISHRIERYRSTIESLSDAIWNHPEVRFDTPYAADLMCELLEQEGFDVMRGVADMPNAFIAEYGHGRPVIGLMAEFDALEGMAYKENCYQPTRKEGIAGHGCGHNILGTGSLLGALIIKTMIDDNLLQGTIRLYGTPAEESGYGKAYFARDGYFDDVSYMMAWHPNDYNGIWGDHTLAVYQAYFRFKGISSHAGAAPELGRSALDAAELMNIGVNFLREHVIDDARIHYAFTNAGGSAANVVHDFAELYYFVRGPQTEDVEAIFERVVKVAEGAAHMTETTVEIEFDGACKDFIANKALSQIMHSVLEDNLPLQVDTTAYEHYQTSETRSRADSLRIRFGFPADVVDKALNPYIAPLEVGQKGHASTDVGDVSWNTPTAQIFIACEPNGTPMHSWQWVDSGKSDVAHAGIQMAARVFAETALRIHNEPVLLEAIQAEHLESFMNKPYETPRLIGKKPKQ